MRISDWSSDVCSSDLVGRLVHHDRGGGAEAGAEFLEPVEIHRRVHDLRRGNQRHRRSAGDHREQIVPAAADAAAMGVDQLAEADAHFLFDDTGLVHMAADLEQLGALVVLAPEAREPRSEEHTSELQSLMRNSYAVFCLTKKKTKLKIQLN